MKKTFLSLAAATLLGLTFSGCEISIVPPEEDQGTKNVETNYYDDYTPEQFQELGEVQPIAPITDLIGHTFYTLDLDDAEYGEAYYSIATINHLDSPDGIVSEDYMLENGEWVQDTYSEDDGSYTIFEVQGDKLHFTGQDCYDDGSSSEQVCEDYENDIYIIDKQKDKWILQSTYNSERFTGTINKVFFLNEPAEVEDPSLITLGNESYNDNYNNYYQDYNYSEDYNEYDYYSNYTIEDLEEEKIFLEQALNSPYLNQTLKASYQSELDKILAEIDSRNSSAASSRVQRTLHRVHKLFR